MKKSACEHELVRAEISWPDGSPIRKCKHCGKYGDISRGYSRGGGHRIMIFKNQNVESEIAEIVRGNEARKAAEATR